MAIHSRSGGGYFPVSMRCSHCVLLSALTYALSPTPLHHTLHPNHHTSHSNHYTSHITQITEQIQVETSTRKRAVQSSVDASANANANANAKGSHHNAHATLAQVESNHTMISSLQQRLDESGMYMLYMSVHLHTHAYTLYSYSY